MQLAAEAVKLDLQSRQINLKSTLQIEDLEKIALARRGLNLATLRAEQGRAGVLRRARPTGNRNRAIDDFEHTFELLAKQNPAPEEAL
jgi:hypothetical protein